MCNQQLDSMCNQQLDLRFDVQPAAGFDVWSNAGALTLYLSAGGEIAPSVGY
jgi:hypothetical protein